MRVFYCLLTFAGKAVVRQFLQQLRIVGLIQNGARHAAANAIR